MKKQFYKKPPGLITIIFAIAVLLFNGSCSKDTKGPDYGKPGKPTPAGSIIIYTDVKPDSVILKMDPASFNLDLNNDGFIDFQFYSTKLFCSSEPVDRRLYIRVAPVGAGFAIMPNNVIPELYLGAAIDSAAVIAPGSLWASTSRLLLSGALSGFGRCPPPFGYWLNVSDKYLGLKFIKGNNTYYGWARLSSSYSATPAPYRHLIPGQLILKDYAYNSIPNQPILAGQTK